MQCSHWCRAGIILKTMLLLFRGKGASNLKENVLLLSFFGRTWLKGTPKRSSLLGSKNEQPKTLEKLRPARETFIKIGLMYIGGVLSCHCLVYCLRYHVHWIPEAIVFSEVASVVYCSSLIHSSLIHSVQPVPAFFSSFSLIVDGTSSKTLITTYSEKFLSYS